MRATQKTQKFLQIVALITLWTHVANIQASNESTCCSSYYVKKKFPFRLKIKQIILKEMNFNLTILELCLYDTNIIFENSNDSLIKENCFSNSINFFYDSFYSCANKVKKK